MSENDKEENVKQDMDEIETINIELEHSVAKLLSKNECLHKEIDHLKRIYKDQFDSIKRTRVRTKEHSECLILVRIKRLHDDLEVTAAKLMFLVYKLLLLVLRIQDLFKWDQHKRTRSAMAQSSGSTTRPNLFADDSGAECDDDDDACFEILIITLICYAAMIPSLRNQGGGSAAPAAEDPNSREKGIMTDAAVAPPVGASRPRPSFGPASLFRDIPGDAIHIDFFSFSPDLSPMIATYLVSGVARKLWFSREEVNCRNSRVLNCLMECCRMGGESLARYRDLIQSHHEYVAGLNDKLSSSDAAFAKSKSKGNERKKKIKSLTKSLDNLHVEVACLSADLNWATILEAEKDEEILHLKATPSEFASFFRVLILSIYEHDVEPLSVILQLKPKKLARLENVPASRDARVFYPLVKESSVTPASKSLEFPFNVILASSTTALDPNEMTDGTVNAKLGSTFVHGASYVVVDAVELTLIGSEHVSSGPRDVVVALSVGEKGDGSLPSFTADEEAAATPFGV
ncbi:hypothetical protein Tco_1062738 [Tanacetum coccineum]